MLAGAACAALMTIAVPVSAATSPEVPTRTATYSSSADQAVAAFYASRQGTPLWLRSGADSNAARELIGSLRRASLDGMPSGPSLAAEAQALMERAQQGDTAALARADRLLSTAWVLYVSALHTPPPGMTFADQWVAPRQESPGQILARAAAADSLAAFVRTTSNVN